MALHLFCAVAAAATSSPVVLRMRSAPVTMTASSSARDAAQALGTWIEERGGSTSNVVAGPTPHGLGLHATEALAPGDVAVSIPSTCVISTQALDTAPTSLQSLCAAVPDEFWAGRLALVLLAERAKGDDAAMAGYVRTLPAMFTVPLFWSPDAIKQLQYPPAQASLLKTAKFVGAFGTDTLGAAPADAFSGQAVDVDAFGWAVAACSTRGLQLGDGARVLCPLIDLANHANHGTANCEVCADADGTIHLKVLKPVGLGEELTYSYGALSNDALLLAYGFVQPSNPFDDLLLAWADGALLTNACGVAGLNGGAVAELAEWQRAALRATLPPDAVAYIRITRSGVDELGMAACRIAAAPDEAALRQADGGRKPLPSASEVRALKIAAAMCAVALTGLPEELEAGAAESAGDGRGDDGVALARRFLAEKGALCSAALATVGDRVKGLQQGETRATMRGHAKPKQAKGVRKQSARKGGAAAKRPKASGFGAK